MVLTTSILTNVRSDIKDYLETVMLYGAVGDDNTTPVAADTTLGNETFRKAIDAFDKTSQSSQITASLKILSTENNGESVVEVGWLTAASAGTLLTHSLVNSISKTSDIQLYLDTTITITVTEG